MVPPSEGHLQRLLDRVKSGSYRASPVRRVYIPKGNSPTELRPIGIPTVEDKVFQRAVVMLLEPIYEQDFLDCSHGFRPQRSAHGALESLWKQTMNIQGGWILEVDIQKFFDHLDHRHLREFLQHRMRDGVLTRLIGKWLKAGVMDEGSVSYPQSGSPQGGVISPILSNVFLHYVLDLWFERVVKPCLRRPAFLIRYADDFAIGFRDERDARRVMEVIPKRFSKYGLTVHPEKTRLIRFQPPSSTTTREKDAKHRDLPGTFDLLGFTHYWGKSRTGRWVVLRKTAASRFSRAVRSSAEWCRFHRSAPAGQRSATEAESKTPRTLRVLRNPGKLSGLATLPIRGPSLLAQVAKSPQSPTGTLMAGVQSSLETFPPSPPASCSLITRSEPLIR